MAAIYNCAGLFVDIEGVNANVTLRHTLEEVPRTEELSSGRLTLATLITILKATLADFSDIVQTIKNSAMMPEDLPARPPSDLEGLGMPNEDPICTIWGKVNGITVTVTSADKPFHALTCYYAMRELSGMATPQQQPPARQSAPDLRYEKNAQPGQQGPYYQAPEPERSASGTIEVGQFDTRENYGQYDGQVIAFEVAMIDKLFTQKGDVYWAFYPWIRDDVGQYPINGLRVYADNEKTPKSVIEFLEAHNASDGRDLRVVVRVAKKGERTNYYVQKIEYKGVPVSDEQTPF